MVTPKKALKGSSHVDVAEVVDVSDQIDSVIVIYSPTKVTGCLLPKSHKHCMRPPVWKLNYAFVAGYVQRASYCWCW